MLRAVFAAMLAVACWAFVSTPVSAASGFAVIISRDVPLENVTFEELRRIMTFKRTLWKTGQPINLLLPGPASPARAFLLRRVYRMSDDDLRRFILERLFQAEIDFAPKVVGDERDAVAFVASGRSVLAIVSADAPGLATVKVLRVDGQLAGEQGYRLQ